MNEIAAMLFPLTIVIAVGLTALFVAKPWRKKRRTVMSSDPTELVVEAIQTGLGREKVVLSPQAKRQLEAEIDQDFDRMEEILIKMRQKEINLRAVSMQIQSSNGGNF